MAVRKTLFHLRFDEEHVNIAPSDAAGGLNDLIEVNAVPAVVDGFTGRAREFGGTHGVAGNDVVAGSTLATRDMTVQALVRWDFDDAVALGHLTGTVVHRGAGGSASDAMPYAVQLRVVNAAARVGEVRFVWQDVAGLVDKVQLGGHFIVPSVGSSSWLMITATRRWVSSSQVEIQYYVGAQLVGDHVSANGDIGGGTDSYTYFGVRDDQAVLVDQLVGAIDEVRLLNYHVTREEVEATWLRLSKFQPRGYKAVRDLFQPEAPVSNDPASRWQKLLRIAGHAIGYSAAQAENVKLNLIPTRSYGPTLEEWERATGEAPRAGDSVDRRRKRVVSHFSQRAGVSPPGVAATVGDMLVAARSQLELLAFDQTTVDTFETLNTSRWFYDPPAQWTIDADALRVQSAAQLNKAPEWYSARMAIGGNGRGAEMVAKIAPTTLVDGTEVGLWFVNRVRWDAFLFGFRRSNAGTIQLVTEDVVGGVLGGATVRATLGALTTHWLHLRHDHDFPAANLGVGKKSAFDARWSAVSGTGPWTEALGAQSAIDVAANGLQWAGFYARTLGGGAANLDVAIDDAKVRAPFGDRAFRFYVIRDPALPGAPDFQGANVSLARLKHAQTLAAAVRAKIARYDDPDTPYNSAPMGGI